MNKINYKGICMFIFVLSIIFSFYVKAEPAGPTLISNTTSSAPVKSALEMNTSGGTITTVVFNATSQDLQWKAYVGNISGRLTLQDSENYTIFDWALTSVQGEVYATRESSSVDWSSIECAQQSHISDEETNLHITSNEADSIQNTFSNVTHAEFYTGTTHFIANACNFTSATYVNNQAQYDEFQEVVLFDGNYLVYSTLISAGISGYNNHKFDFQMIVPEDSSISTNEVYYFYVELS